MIPFPRKKYKIIYADPPWSYRDKASAGKRGAGYKYNTQSIDYLNNLPVKHIADKDCVLFLWVTMPKLNECFEVIKNWGFEYKTVAFTWIKKNKLENTWFMGMGGWTRANAELCLLATKGSIKRIDAGISSIICTSIQNHSKKPDIVRDKIVQLVGDLPRIELFARIKTPEIELFERPKPKGWDLWGDELD